MSISYKWTKAIAKMVSEGHWRKHTVVQLFLNFFLKLGIVCRIPIFKTVKRMSTGVKLGRKGRVR